MSTYSVADAKASLPRLIDRAMAGEEVVITRHGKPVAELRAAPTIAPALDMAASYARLREGRLRPRGPPTTSVELLDQIYEERG